MAYQMTFKRYELKYLLNKKEKEEILLAMKPHMKLDDYGRTVIRNIYFDTENFRLIRRSYIKKNFASEVINRYRLRIRYLWRLRKSINRLCISADFCFRKRQ